MLPQPLIATTHQDRPVLAIATGLHPDSLEGIQVVKNYRASAWVWDGRQVREWMPNGVLTRDGQLYVWGLPLAGFPSPPVDGSTADVWALASAAAGFLTALDKAGRLPEKICSHQLCFGAGGQLLLLPFGLASRLYGLKTTAVATDWAPLLHPQARSAAAAAFLVAALTWRALTETYPYLGTDAEQTADLMRETRLPPAAWAVPGLVPPLATALDRALTGRATGADLAALSQALTGRTADQAITKLPETARQPLLLKATRWRGQQAGRRRRRTFLRKNRLALILWTVGGSFALVFFGGLFLSPKVTANPLTAGETVHHYYAAMDKADDRTMLTLVGGDWEKDPFLKYDHEEAVSFFLQETIRMKMYPLGGGEYLDAQTWVDQDRPRIEEDAMVYGIANLTITPLTPSTWQATYEKWLAVTAKAGKNPAVTKRTGEKRIDTVFLQATGAQWKITKLARRIDPF